MKKDKMEQTSFVISEIFTSIQGEGIMSGKVMNFIRFCSCNLNCRWCDTPREEGEKHSLEEILDSLNKKAHWVSLTGGEPMCEEHRDLKELISEIKKRGYSIYLETNGTIFEKEIFEMSEFISLDVKAPSTGEFEKMEPEGIRYCLDNEKKSQLKLVLKDKEDFNYFKRIYKQHSGYSNWILQPEWGTRHQLDYTHMIEEMDPGMIQKVRIIPQLHKTLNIQ